MNNCFEEWKAIEVRINGLESLLNNFLETIKIFGIYNQAMAQGVHHISEDKLDFFKKTILPIVEEIMLSIKIWSENRSMPTEITNSIEKANLDWWLQNAKNNHNSMRKHCPVAACQAIFPIFALRNEINYLLKDAEHKIKGITELAFAHLSRSIVVDNDIKKKWEGEKNETDYEKLGAIHLLSHGIWAFKIYGDSARTDLIYQDSLEKYKSDIERSADGLVLTEWKVVRSAGSVDEIAKKARNQMKKYADGVLSRVECVLSASLCDMIATIN